MRKLYTLAAMLLASHLTFSQTWTIYNADIDPINATPAWSIGDLNNGPGATVAFIDDIESQGNKLMTYSSTTTNRNSWKLNVTK